MIKKPILMLLLAMMYACASKPAVPTEKKVKKVIPTIKKTVTDTGEKKDGEDEGDVDPESPKIYLKKTEQQFKNGEWVYEIIKDDHVYGEWWPVSAIDLVTNESNPDLFEDDLETIVNEFKAIAAAPDGMTTGASPGKLEGKALIDGVLYEGDGTDPRFGILFLEEGGRKITFTHRDEILKAYDSMDDFFEEHEGDASVTIFYTPSIKREAQELNNDTLIHRALVNRVDADNKQLVGMVVLKEPIKNKEMIALMNGLNRTDKNGKVLSKTTHIFYTDGGKNYGQAARLDKDNAVTLLGTRNPEVVTNYMILY